jgi:hypothetical protein
VNQKRVFSEHEQCLLEAPPSVEKRSTSGTVSPCGA